MSKMNKIMLRFRPIAPRPVTVESPSGGSRPENVDVACRSGRVKKKYTRGTTTTTTTNATSPANNNNNNKRCNKRNRASPEGKSNCFSSGTTVVTLPLLPETPERKENSPVRWSPLKNIDAPTNLLPMWLSFNNGQGGIGGDVPMGCRGLDHTVVMMPKPVRMAGACVTVECVTDTWVEVYGLGRTDDERRSNLERDTCPGFISDGSGSVMWTNESFRKLVAQDGCGEEQQSEMRVWLVMREKLPVTAGGELYAAFTCRVRIQYMSGKERSSSALPCDVWKMDGGGFAWKMDIKAALSLGRPIN